MQTVSEVLEAYLLKISEKWNPAQRKKLQEILFIHNSKKNGGNQS